MIKQTPSSHCSLNMIKRQYEFSQCSVGHKVWSTLADKRVHCMQIWTETQKHEVHNIGSDNLGHIKIGFYCFHHAKMSQDVKHTNI
jgi:hypothetical protein